MPAPFRAPKTRTAKIGIVVAGYIAAIALAVGAVALGGVDARGLGAVTSDGMAAGSDSLLFLAAFGVAAIPATAAAFYFLRAVPRVWPVLAGIAVAISITAIVALIAYLAPPSLPGDRGSGFAALSVLRIIIAPLFAIAFSVAGLFAPTRNPRIALFVAGAVEAIAFGCALAELLSRAA